MFRYLSCISSYFVLFDSFLLQAKRDSSHVEEKFSSVEEKVFLVAFFSHSSHGIKAGSFSLFSYSIISLLFVHVFNLYRFSIVNSNRIHSPIVYQKSQPGRHQIWLDASHLGGWERACRGSKDSLEREDVNLNQADNKYGRTPLSWVVEYGHKGVVKMLLEREDVSPNQTDTEYGATPLSWAAESGHERVVKMLLEREDVNPSQTDTKYGRTPLT